MNPVRTALAALAVLGSAIFAVSTAAAQPSAISEPGLIELAREFAVLRVQPTETGWASQIEAEVTWVILDDVNGIEAEIFLPSEPNSAAARMTMSNWAGVFRLELGTSRSFPSSLVDTLTGFGYGTEGEEPNWLVFTDAYEVSPGVYRLETADRPTRAEMTDIYSAGMFTLTFTGADGDGEMLLEKGVLRMNHPAIDQPQEAFVTTSPDRVPVVGRVIWRLFDIQSSLMIIAEIETPDGMRIEVDFLQIDGTFAVRATLLAGDVPGGRTQTLFPHAIAVESAITERPPTPVPTNPSGAYLVVEPDLEARTQLLAADIIHLFATAEDGRQIQITIETGPPGKALFAVLAANYG